MKESEKIILDLCGGTGSWSRFYKEAGYDVRVITLPKYDVLTYQPPENVYGILAAPPVYGVFRFELQSGSEGEETGRRPKGCYGLSANHRKVQAEVVGT